VVHEEIQVLMGGGMVLAQSHCRYCAHHRLVFLEHSAQGYAYLDLRLVKQISGLFIISRGTSAVTCAGHVALVRTVNSGRFCSNGRDRKYSLYTYMVVIWKSLGGGEPLERTSRW